MRALCLALALTLVACRDAPPPLPPAGEPASTREAPWGERVTPPDTGLTAEANAPHLIEAALGALECPWASGYDLACHGYVRWLDALKVGTPDATLVRFIEDADPRVRYLGAVGLLRRGAAYRADPDLAARVIAAAEDEREPAIAPTLGAAVARLDARRLGLTPRVVALVAEHPLPGLRAALVGDLLTHDGSDDCFDATRARLSADPDEGVRLAALMAYWTGGVARAAEVCALWRDHLGDRSRKVADKAAQALATWGRCADRFDALLAAFERRLPDGSFSFAHANALYAAVSDASAPRDFAARAVALARRVAADPALGWDARNRALDLLVAFDPEASELVAALIDDPAVPVRTKAQALSAAAEARSPAPGSGQVNWIPGGSRGRVDRPSGVPELEE